MGLALILTATAFVAYILVVRRHFSSVTDTLLAAFVLTVTQIVVLEIAVATVGFLQPVPLAVANVLLSTGVLALGLTQDPRGTVRAIFRRLGGFWRLLKRSPLSLLLVVLLLVLSVWVLLLIAVWPESSYDGMAYHLTIAFSRIDFGDMRLLVCDPPPWISAYPEYSELLMAWTAIFDRVPAFVDGAQWVFWPAGLLAAYALGRKLGCSPMAALQGSALFAFAPAVILQSRVAYNDLMVASLFIIALNLLTEQSTFPSFVAGAAMGLIAGIKYSSVFFPVVGGLALLIACHKDLFNRERSPWPRLLAYALPILALGLPWYLANWINFRNPVWPFTVQVGGHRFFPGLLSVADLFATALKPEYRDLPRWFLKLYFWLEPSKMYTYDAHYDGLGPLWAILGAPAALYMLLTGFRERKPAWMITLLGTGGLYLAQINDWKPRYSMFILGLGAVGVAWVLHTVTPWTKRLTQGLLFGGILWTLCLVGPMEMIPVSKVATYARLPADLRPHTLVADRPVYRWLEGNTYPGAKLVYGHGLDFLAPLWENDLDNRVLYVDTTELETWRLAVVQQGANYVFAGKDFSDRWIGTSEGLERVYEDNRFVVYRVSPMELRER